MPIHRLAPLCAPGTPYVRVGWRAANTSSTCRGRHHVQVQDRHLSVTPHAAPGGRAVPPVGSRPLQQQPQSAPDQPPSQPSRPIAQAASASAAGAEAGHSAPLAPQQLTSKLQHATSWQQLLELCQQHLQQLNEIHVAIALMRCASIAKQERPLEKDGVQQRQDSLSPSSNTSSSSSSSGGVASATSPTPSAAAAAAADELKHPPSTVLQQLQALLLPAAIQLLPSFSQRVLSNVMYACAQLSWYHPVLVDSCCQLTFELSNELTPQHLSTILWSLAQLGCEPAEPLLRRLLHNAFSRGRQFKPQDLAMLLGALPSTTPQVRRTQQLSALAFELLPAASPGQLAQFAAGLARLGGQVDSTWWGRFWPVSQQRLHEMSAKELSMLSWGLAQLGGSPPEQWQQQYLAAVLTCNALGAGSSSSYGSSSIGGSSSSSSGNRPIDDPPQLVQAALLLYGCGHLCDQLMPSSLMQRWFATTQLQSSTTSSRSCSMQLLSSLLVAAARSAVVPPAPWLLPVLQQVLQQTPSCSSPHHVVLSCWALASLGVKPSQTWVDQLLTGAQHLLPHLQPADVAQLLWCFVRWQYQPSQPQLLDGFWAVAGKQLMRGRALDVAVAAAAVAALQQQGGQGILPPEGWVERVVKAAGRGHKAPPRWQQWLEGRRLKQQLQRQVQLLKFQQQQLTSSIAELAAAAASDPGSPGSSQQQQQQLLEQQLARMTADLQQLQQQLSSSVSNRQHPAAPSSPWPRTPQRRQRVRPTIPAVAAVQLDGRRWSGWSGPQLAWLARSAAQLGVGVAYTWKETLVAAALQQADALSPQATANLVWGMGNLRYTRASPHWVAHLLSATGHLPSSFTPGQLVMLVTGCRQLRAAPSAAWLLRLFDWTEPRLRALGARGLLQLLRMCGALGLRPPATWLAAADRVLPGFLVQYPPMALLQALRAVAWVQLVPSEALLSAAVAAVAAAAAAGPTASPTQQQPPATAAALAAAEGGAGSPVAEPGAPSSADVTEQLQQVLQQLQQAAADGQYTRRQQPGPVEQRRRMAGLQGRRQLPAALVPRLAQQQVRLRRLGQLNRQQAVRQRHIKQTLRLQREAADAEAAAGFGVGTRTWNPAGGGNGLAMSSLDNSSSMLAGMGSPSSTAVAAVVGAATS